MRCGRWLVTASTRSWCSAPITSTLAPNALQNARSFVDRRGIGACGRREDGPSVDEQFGEAGVRARMLGAGDRMRRDEMHGLRQQCLHVAQHRGLDRADIGDDGAGLEMRRDLLCHRAAGADRHAGDDEIGVLDCLGAGRGDAMAERQFRRRAWRTAASASDTTSSCARSSALTARASEEPIRPRPISAMRGKVAVSLTVTPASGNRGAHRPPVDWLLERRPSGAAPFGSP